MHMNMLTLTTSLSVYINSYSFFYHEFLTLFYLRIILHDRMNSKKLCLKRTKNIFSIKNHHVVKIGILNLKGILGMNISLFK